MASTAFPIDHAHCSGDSISREGFKGHCNFIADSHVSSPKSKTSGSLLLKEDEKSS